MGGEPEWIAEEARPLYHAALALGRQPPGHPGRRVHGPAAHGRRRAPPTGCSARCWAPPWTTRCAPGTRRSPGPSRAGTRARSPRMSRELRKHAPQTRRRLSGDGPRDRRPRARARPAQAGAGRGPPRRARRQRRRTRPTSPGHAEERRGRRDEQPHLRSCVRRDGRRTPTGTSARRDTRAVVMTMGALHEGHATLIRTAREHVGPDGQVVRHRLRQPPPVRQGRGPRPLPAHPRRRRRLAEQAGADAVFAPSVDEVYPGGEPQVRISAGPMGERLEGRHAPRALRRHAHRRRQAAAPHPARRGLLRAEGRPAARPDPPDGPRPELRRRDRRRPDRARGRRPGPVQPQPLSVRRRSGVRRSPSPRPCSRAATGTPPRRRCARGPATVPATHARAAGPQRARRVPRRRRRARRRAGPAGPALPPPSGPPPASVLDEAARLRPPLVLDYLALVDPADFTEIPDDRTRRGGPRRRRPGRERPG